MTIPRSLAALAALCSPVLAPVAGDAGRGAQAFRVCASCHSLGAGMGGDRAQVVFAAPGVISALVWNDCR